LTATPTPRSPSSAGGRAAVGPHPGGPAPTGGVGGVVLLVTTRMGLWMGVQLGLAGLVILAGTADAPGHALEAVAGWWMVYGVLVDLGTLGVIGWLLGRDGGSYRGLLGPPTTIGQVAVGALGVLAVSVPAVVFSSQLTSSLYGQATAPLFAVVNLPPWAGLVAVVVVPLVAELAEPVAYLGVVLPRAGTAPGPLLAGRRHRGRPVGGRAWPVSAVGRGGRLDWGLVAYRVGSVLPFLAAWTAAYYALGRRLLPVMAARWVINTGTALALTLIA
jgi:hypothetical protein